MIEDVRRMLLSDVVPLAKIEALIGEPLSVERINGRNWRQLVSRDPESLLGVAGRVWHLAVTEPGSHLNPLALAPYFRRQDPALPGAVEKAIGRPLLKEFGFMEATVSRKGKPFIAATSLVTHLSEAELHWYDISMANPAKPISKRKRRSPSQHFAGFGLLGEVVSAIFAAARERGCSVVSLTAAFSPLVPVFERFGFRVEDNELGRLSRINGISIPMSAPVPRSGDT
jgi:hypothetical protein